MHSGPRPPVGKGLRGSQHDQEKRKGQVEAHPQQASGAEMLIYVYIHVFIYVSETYIYVYKAHPQQAGGAEMLDQAL